MNVILRQYRVSNTARPAEFFCDTEDAPRFDLDQPYQRVVVAAADTATCPECLEGPVDSDGFNTGDCAARGGPIDPCPACWACTCDGSC